MDDDITAKVGSRGQVTIPKKVRDALEISGGEQVVFRLDQQRAVVATDESLLEGPELVAVVQPPASRRMPWDAARRSLLGARAKPLQPGAPLSEPTEPEITVDLRAVEDAEVETPET